MPYPAMNATDFASTLTLPSAGNSSSKQAPWPKSVLLDLDEARQLFLSHPDEAAMEIEDACLECKPPRGGSPKDPRDFRMIANGRECRGTLLFDGAKEEYVLASTDLARLYRYAEGTRQGTLIDFLNSRQAFTVVPETPEVIYSESGFFDPRLGLGPRFDPSALGLDDMIRHVPALRACTSEKGPKASALPTGWAGNSTFDWIDRNAADLLPDADLVLCDDGQNECCDFLLAGRRAGRETVVMVHAKASDGSFVSAGALHEVCSQAAKQIGTIGQFSPVEPKQVGLWSGAWKGPGGRHCRREIESLSRRVERARWSRHLVAVARTFVEPEHRTRSRHGARSGARPASAVRPGEESEATGTGHSLHPSSAFDHGRGGERERQIDRILRVRSHFP
jgi:hypothetical protein